MKMLDGVRIVEIEGLGPCPITGMLLADLGADVIVVHRTGTPTMPGLPERPIQDRGKRSILLDLKDPADVAALLGLIRTADGLIEGFRPGVMEKLGLGPAACHAVNPALVFGRLTGWGQTGPLASAAGHDLNYIAMSGAAWYASEAGDPPFTPPTLVGDIGGGSMYLAVGMLAGILKARETGQGTVIDAAIYDGSAHMMNLLMTMHQGGVLGMTRGRNTLDGPHWSRAYRTSDGGYMSVQSLEPKFYATFLDLLGLKDDPDFARQNDPKAWPGLTARLRDIFATRTRAEWEALFLGTDACVAPVLSPQQAAEHRVNAERKTWHTSRGTLEAAPAPRFAGQGDWTPPPIPARGEHQDEILGELNRER
jgi:crotonobetainyl-CoA:carnitine CoA-transferase CaiB-like acyl-CoA transferase|tara:strand:- start:9276 stop:10373 length:1098 start_codon:yes stop_codon:yes gene_type:complete